MTAEQFDRLVNRSLDGPCRSKSEWRERKHRYRKRRQYYERDRRRWLSCTPKHVPFERAMADAMRTRYASRRSTSPAMPSVCPPRLARARGAGRPRAVRSSRSCARSGDSGDGSGSGGDAEPSGARDGLLRAAQRCPRPVLSTGRAGL